MKASVKLFEKDVKHLEEYDVPLNPASAVVGEGSLSVVFIKMFNGNRHTAVKNVKQSISQKNILEAANTLIKLIHKNIVKFLGFSDKPSALIFEYCEIRLDDSLTVDTLRELINVFNDHDYYCMEERLDYICQAARGIHFLHRNGIIHIGLISRNLL